MNFSLIAACDSKRGIGKNGKLPWNLPGDLAYFNKTTVGNGKNAVIMGRLTWESIPVEHRPLPGRKNIVITRNQSLELPSGVNKAESLEEALRIASQCVPEEIFVIGGSQIFYDAIQNPSCKKLYITAVEGNFECDVFFPEIDTKKFKKTWGSTPHKENGVGFIFTVLERSD